MKIITGDYDVALSKAKIVTFINKKVKLQYWIALEDLIQHFKEVLK